MNSNTIRSRCCVCRQWIEPGQGHFVGDRLVRHNAECKPPAYSQRRKTKAILKLARDFLAP